mgnify:CR=1 FL=1
MERLQVGKNQVNVRIQGQGEPVLLLHGVPDSSEVWEKVMDSLSDTHRCIAPDLPGFGQTKADKRFGYSLDSLADFVDQLLVAAKISGKVGLVIHDIGGIVGLAFATKYPDKVSSLTIMGTTFFSDHKWHALASTWRKPIFGDLAMHLMRYKQFSSAMQKVAPILTEEQIRSNYKALTFSNRRLILKFYRTLNPSIFAGWEERMLLITRQIPTQVIWGENDSFLPVSLSSRFGTTNVNILQGVGHWPMLEQPLEVAKLVKKILEKNLSNSE